MEVIRSLCISANSSVQCNNSAGLAGDIVIDCAPISNNEVMRAPYCSWNPVSQNTEFTCRPDEVMVGLCVASATVPCGTNARHSIQCCRILSNNASIAVSLVPPPTCAPLPAHIALAVDGAPAMCSSFSAVTAVCTNCIARDITSIYCDSPVQILEDRALVQPDARCWDTPKGCPPEHVVVGTDLCTTFTNRKSFRVRCAPVDPIYNVLGGNCTTVTGVAYAQCPAHHAAVRIQRLEAQSARCRKLSARLLGGSAAPASNVLLNVNIPLTSANFINLTDVQVNPVYERRVRRGLLADLSTDPVPSWSG